MIFMTELSKIIFFTSMGLIGLFAIWGYYKALLNGKINLGIMAGGAIFSVAFLHVTSFMSEDIVFFSRACVYLIFVTVGIYHYHLIEQKTYSTNKKKAMEGQE